MEGMSVWLISIKQGRTTSITEEIRDGAYYTVASAGDTSMGNEDQISIVRDDQ